MQKNLRQPKRLRPLRKVNKEVNMQVKVEDDEQSNSKVLDEDVGMDIP